ncbi:MAG: ribosome small subunit-dependent GTPase A [Gemmatimonadetes bacterium]|nr:MAG: ribosome small subunit-dependent GTPase A [Gemmatimonadota bacterium]
MKNDTRHFSGLVTRALGQTIYVRPDGTADEIICYLRKTLKQDPTVLSPIAVGDWVQCEQAPNDERGVITEILPRKNKLSRQSSPIVGSKEDILAANLDQIIIVVAAAQPDPTVPKIDRFLVIAEACEIPAVLVFNKMDIAPPELDSLIQIYASIGYPCLKISAKTGENIDQLKTILQDKLSVLIGFSGVGKSTTLNAIEPDLSLRVGKISQKTGKGRHTTTAAQMFDLSLGGAIVDTPGLKELSIWGIDKVGLSLCYPEMVPLLDNCYFDDCIHVTEPNCAVKAALDAGQIHPMRYESYCRILQNLA